MEIDQEALRELIDYCPATGLFTRKKALTQRAARHVGKQCGAVNKVTGYVEMHVGGRLYYGHRLAWIWTRGQIPEGMRVDHRNTCRSDNRIDNLRLATHADNLRNCKVRVDNTSGVKGVHFDARRGRWCAEVAGRKLGRFETLLDAAAARKSAALAAFGEFARE